MSAVQPPSVPDENCVEKRVDLLGDAVGDTALKARGKKISYEIRRYTPRTTSWSRLPSSLQVSTG